MPVQTPLDVFESCGAESLYYWADWWRLESFSLGGSKVKIADRWVMTALRKAIYSSVAGRSWPTLCSCLLFPTVILSRLAKREKSKALFPCNADTCLVKEQYFSSSRRFREIFHCQIQSCWLFFLYFVFVVS